MSGGKKTLFMMDFRKFLKVLEEEDALYKVKTEVDPKHELGAICKIHNERPGSSWFNTFNHFKALNYI